VLDSATRERRQKRHLESLEKDNFHDDPHAAFAHLIAKTKLPAFSDGSESEWL
jgi:zinc finger HIT domain-containing protein 1